MKFTRRNTVSSICSSSWFDLDPSQVKEAMQIMAAMRPRAVAFKAKVMPRASSLLFCEGSADSSAEKASCRPKMVPSNPTRVQRLASRPR